MELVFPQGNEEELLKEAEKLGVEIILCYKQVPAKKQGTTAILITDKKDIAKNRKKSDLLLAPPERQFFEDKRIDGIIGFGLDPRKDHTHYRKSITQVEAELAKKNNLQLFYVLSDIETEIVLGRWMQDKKILKKKGLKGQVVSGAKKPLDMRDQKALDAVWDVL